MSIKAQFWEGKIYKINRLRRKREGEGDEIGRAGRLLCPE
jgi:hypothetical protein